MRVASLVSHWQLDTILQHPVPPSSPDIGWLNWEWRPEVILTLAVLGTVYCLGWWRLRQSGHHGIANGWRLASYIGGLAVLALALLSTIDLLQQFLFSMHMVQHVLMMMIAAPLIMLANPLPISVWGLPPAVRLATSRLLARKALTRRVLRRATTPLFSWTLFTLAFWGWHIPSAYDAALRTEWIHNLEHLSFFWTAILFWWHVTGSAPRIHSHLGYGSRIVYLLTTLIHSQALAISITFAGQPIYSYYTTVPRLWNLSVMDDQALGGSIMWVPAGMMYIVAIVVLLARWLNQEERRQEQREDRQAKQNGMSSLENHVV